MCKIASAVSGPHPPPPRSSLEGPGTPPGASWSPPGSPPSLLQTAFSQFFAILRKSLRFQNSTAFPSSGASGFFFLMRSATTVSETPSSSAWSCHFCAPRIFDFTIPQHLLMRTQDNEMSMQLPSAICNLDASGRQLLPDSKNSGRRCRRRRSQ